MKRYITLFLATTLVTGTLLAEETCKTGWVPDEMTTDAQWQACKGELVGSHDDVKTVVVDQQEFKCDTSLVPDEMTSDRLWEVCAQYSVVDREIYQSIGSGNKELEDFLKDIAQRMALNQLH